MPKRNRPKYFLMIIFIIILGLFSRSAVIPKCIYPYLGDAFYALMFFFLIGFLFPRLSSSKTFLSCISICVFIELTQLYQAEWILVLRQTQIGALVLGHGFLWSDLVAYFVGGLLGFLLEEKLLSKIDIE